MQCSVFLSSFDLLYFTFIFLSWYDTLSQFRFRADTFLTVLLGHDKYDMPVKQCCNHIQPNGLLLLFFICYAERMGCLDHQDWLILPMLHMTSQDFWVITTTLTILILIPLAWSLRILRSWTLWLQGSFKMDVLQRLPQLDRTDLFKWWYLITERLQFHTIILHEQCLKGRVKMSAVHNSSSWCYLPEESISFDYSHVADYFSKWLFYLWPRSRIITSQMSLYVSNRDAWYDMIWYEWWAYQLCYTNNIDTDTICIKALIYGN